MKVSLKSVISEKEMARWAELLVAGVRRDIVKLLDKTGKAMQTHAVNGHRYTNRTGKAEKSISYKVDNMGTHASMTFYIDPANVRTPDGYNYAWIQNDGSLSGYNRGYLSPTAKLSPKQGRGIQADDYMGNAWNSVISGFDAKLEEIANRMKVK